MNRQKIEKQGHQGPQDRISTLEKGVVSDQEQLLRAFKDRFEEMFDSLPARLHRRRNPAWRGDPLQQSNVGTVRP